MANDEGGDQFIGEGLEEGHNHGGHHIASEVSVVLFVFVGLLIGGFCREINKKTNIPYTPMLLVIGIKLVVKVVRYVKYGVHMMWRGAGGAVEG